MKFDAYTPNKLSGLVDLIWELEIPHPGTFTVLPSGKVELIFPIHIIENLEAVKISPQDNPVNNHACFLSGLHTKPLKMSFGHFHTFGIQMKPVAVKALFGMPLCEIRDYFIGGDVIFDTINTLVEQLHCKSGFTERAQWFENYMFNKINETADLHIAINLDRAIKQYIVQKPNGSSKTIETLLGYSRTHTFRLFNEWFGISAHAYQRLLQFINAVETLHDSNLKLTDTGLENGFYDQSHFIRTFQDYANMTPGVYRKQMSAIPGQIFEYGLV